MTHTRKLSNVAGVMRAGVFADLQTRIDAAVARGADLVPLHIGDTCVAPPATGEQWRAPASLAAYGATNGLAALRRAFADRLMRLGYGPPAIDPERHVLVGSGATHALACAARVVLSEGDDVLLLAPYWPLAHGIISACGARAIEVPFTDRLYAGTVDVEATLEAHRTAATRALYLITPNNPDGKVLGEDELARIAAFAEKHDLWVFADEAYADWVYEGTHRSFAALPGMAARTISAYSASKSHALAGARIGCVVADASVIAAARRVSVHTVFNVPVAMQEAAVAAFADAAWCESARAQYKHAKGVAQRALAGTGLAWHEPQGGAYLFVDCAPVLGDAPLARLLELAVDEGVLVTPGDAFGAAYAKWVRICFTSVPEARLVTGLERWARAVARHRGR